MIGYREGQRNRLLSSGAAGEYRMIHSFEIENFRCFERMPVDGCRLVNVIVGDNGAGKTSWLEAIFFALGHSPEIGLRFRQLRGMDGMFTGSSRKIEEAIWRDLFYKRDWSREIFINLKGDGEEARSVRVSRQPTIIPLDENSPPASGPIQFSWTDAVGRMRSFTPTMSPAGLKFDTSEEINPDFYYFSSTTNTSSAENANRFSELDSETRSNLIEGLRTEYGWIQDLQIEVAAGSPYLSVHTRNGDRQPLAMISSGINRIVGIMIAIASRERSVVVVDEMENGIYFQHHEAIWRIILALCRNYQCQLFSSSHSAEWLRAMVKASGLFIDDMRLYRLERDADDQPELFSFEGEDLKSGVEFGVDVRASSG